MLGYAPSNVLQGMRGCPYAVQLLDAVPSLIASARITRRQLSTPLSNASNPIKGSKLSAHESMAVNRDAREDRGGSSRGSSGRNIVSSLATKAKTRKMGRALQGSALKHSKELSTSHATGPDPGLEWVVQQLQAAGKVSKNLAVDPQRPVSLILEAVVETPYDVSNCGSLHVGGMCTCARKCRPVLWVCKWAACACEVCVRVCV